MTESEFETYQAQVDRAHELLRSRANLALAIGLLLGAFHRIVATLDPDEIASISQPLELARKIIFSELYPEDSPQSDPESNQTGAAAE